jgi:hypothetical protein
MAGLSLVPEDERGGQQPGEVAAELESAILQKFGNPGAEYAAKVGSKARHAVPPLSLSLSLSLVQLHAAAAPPRST